MLLWREMQWEPACPWFGFSPPTRPVPACCLPSRPIRVAWLRVTGIRLSAGWLRGCGLCCHLLAVSRHIPVLRGKKRRDICRRELLRLWSWCSILIGRPGRATSNLCCHVCLQSLCLHHYHQWCCTLRPWVYHNARLPRLLDQDMRIGYVDAGKLVPALYTSPHASFINE